MHRAVEGIHGPGGRCWSLTPSDGGRCRGEWDEQQTGHGNSTKCRSWKHAAISFCRRDSPSSPGGSGLGPAAAPECAPQEEYNRRAVDNAESPEAPRPTLYSHFDSRYQPNGLLGWPLVYSESDFGALSISPR